MKYVKMFENWLLEADGGGIKPFDPNKPYETLVVDIAGKDMPKDSAGIGTVLASVFNRMIAGEDSPNAKETVKVTPAKVVRYTNIKEGGGQSSAEISAEGKNFAYKFPRSLDSSSKIQEYLKDAEDRKLDIFFVTPPGYEFEENKAPQINWKDNKILLMIPKYNNDSFDGDGFFASSDYNLRFLVSVKPFQEAGNWSIGELSQIIGSFGNSNSRETMMSVSNSTGGYKGIAKALGYEIPEKYTPKQGGIKKGDKKA